jgi:dihydrolipoamide dehydrogenase
MSRQVDVAVIGAGTAGLNAFRRINQMTSNVVLINDGHYGTTCARVGCMPSKVLIEVANKFASREHFDTLGINGSESLTVDRAQVMAYVRQQRDWFVARVMDSFDKSPEKNINGRARFVEPQVLEVNGERIQADKIIIATGSRPIVPPAWRKFGNKLITTDEFFELETLPDSIAVIGLGAIGSEIGQALARLGVRVVGIEKLSSVCGLSEPTISKVAIDSLSKDFELWLESEAHLSEGPNGSIKVDTNNGRSTTVDMVLASLGRQPNFDDMGLEVLGLDFSKGFKGLVNPNTTQLADFPIFVAGDVSSYRMILHDVADEGAIAGYNAMRDKVEAFKRRVPLRIAFTEPQVVVVGKSVAEAKADQDIIIGERSFSVQGRTKIMDRNYGHLCVYAEPKSGRLLGAEMMMPDGEYVGHFLAMAIENELTVQEVMRTPFYHPTILEGLDNALNAIFNQLEDSRKGPVLRKI